MFVARISNVPVPWFGAVTYSGEYDATKHKTCADEWPYSIKSTVATVRRTSIHIIKASERKSLRLVQPQAIVHEAASIMQCARDCARLHMNEGRLGRQIADAQVSNQP